MKKGVILGISALAGAATGAVIVGVVTSAKIDRYRAYAEKCVALFQMMNNWVKIKQKGKTIASYMEAEGYKRIAIYGMSYVGETLLDELRESGVQVAYGIDQHADAIYTADLDVVQAEDDLEEVDAIIVTAITYFEGIAEKLADKISCPVVSLEDIIYEVNAALPLRK